MAPEDDAPTAAPGPAPGPSKGDRWRALLAPGLLAVLGLLQIALVFGAGLSPWKGGGFGMFASLDHGFFRRVVVTDAAGLPVAIPPELDRRRRELRDFPQPAALTALGEALQEADPGLGALTVEVRGLGFAPADLHPITRSVRTVRVPGHGPSASP